MQTIYIVFYKPKVKETSFFGTLQRKFEFFIEGYYIQHIPFTHVEFGVDDDETGDVISYGINNNEFRIHEVHNKTWSNPDYEEPIILAFEIKKSKFMKCMDFIKKIRDRWEGFDSNYYLYFVPVINWFMSREEKLWFCSKFVAKLLITAGIKDVDSNIYISPEMLYNEIKDLGEFVSSSNIRTKKV
jgi:hypothetical protein